jgi:hypothetical protein
VSVPTMVHGEIDRTMQRIRRREGTRAVTA